MDIETRTMRRVTVRLVPFLVLCYFIAFLDRSNLGYAALKMNADIHVSPRLFGIGAGIVFFVPYFLFEVPSNIALARFGARIWIARIMLTWGIISGCMVFVTGDTSFFVVRALLGAAEAGFFPGIIFFLTLWFPAAYRARISGYFMAAIPLSAVVGSPLSGLLLQLDGAMGLHGWQWMFVLEALPAIVLAGFVLIYLQDRPALAGWLPADERAWLDNRLEQEARQRIAAKHYSLGEALTNPKVLALSLVYFGAVSCLYGTGFFLPQIVAEFGLSAMMTLLVTAIPAVVGVFACIAWSRSSDARQERKGHLLISLALATFGTLGCTLVSSPVLKMVSLSIAAFGIYGALPVFWTLPTAFLSGTAAAGGIAIINALGNLSGGFGPYMMGSLKESTGNFNAGLQVLAATGAMGFVVLLLLGHDSRLERAPEPAE